jgi:hypothetical protein
MKNDYSEKVEFVTCPREWAQNFDGVLIFSQLYDITITYSRLIYPAVFKCSCLGEK